MKPEFVKDSEIKDIVKVLNKKNSIQIEVIYFYIIIWIKYYTEKLREQFTDV